jgi:hypothetical protein
MPQIETPQSLCRLGIARWDVTPPVGIYHRMWGAATHDRATGVHRPLTATALVLRPYDETRADDEVVFIAVDHCLLWGREMDQLLGSVASATGVARERLLVAFSHTHAAGLMGLERVNLPGGDLVPAYLDSLARSISAIVTQARREVQPAAIAYATGRCTLAANRDLWDADSGQFVCGFNPDGPADDAVLIARATAPDGKVLATMVNYACHPTTLAWQNTLISPDYPGAMREVVERTTGAPCVFLQGASGDLGPRDGYVGDAAVADRNGRQLGHAALAAIESLPPAGTLFRYAGPVTSGATIGTWRHVAVDVARTLAHQRWRFDQWRCELPYRNDLPAHDETQRQLDEWQQREASARRAGNDAEARTARAMAERVTRLLGRLSNLPPGTTFPLPVAVLSVGDAVWVAVEGEHYHLLQRSLRERFPATPIIVATLTNGSRPAYLPTRAAYDKPIYQSQIAVLAPGSLEHLTHAIGDTIAGGQLSQGHSVDAKP